MARKAPPVTGHRRGAAGSLRLLIAASILAVPGGAEAQPGVPDSARSTLAGAYTAAQAASGSEVYALQCASCHTPASHTGPAFTAKWEGRLLSDLYEYIRGSMPKSDPGSLTSQEYAQVMAYLLRMNDLPAGAVELPADSSALARIRITFKPARDTSAKR